MRKLSLIKRIPNYKSLLFLIILAGVAEGIGVSALVPVLSSLTGDFSDIVLPPPFNFLPSFLSYVGISPSFESMLIATLGIMLAAYVLIYFQERMVINARYNYLENIRGSAISSIFDSEWQYLSNLKSGSVSNIVINESNRAAEGLLSMMTLLAISVQLFVYGAFAFILSWQMFLVALVSITLSVITAKRLIRIVRILGEESVKMNALFSRQFVEFIRGSKLIKATGMVKETSKKLSHSNKVSAKANRNIVINQAKMRFELQVFLSISMVVILYVAVSWFKVEVAVLLVFMFIIIRLAPRFTSFQGQLQNFSSFLPSIEAVDSMIAQSRSTSNKNTSRKLNNFKLNSNIIFSDISYSYQGQNVKALIDINLKINAKDFIAFVGPSGSGKSSALDILMGLLEPENGSVSYDGIDLNSIDKTTLQAEIGLVNQDTIFFVGSIFDNLCFGLDKSIEVEHIWKCLKIAQLDEFIGSLPDGLQSQLGESGLNLSGGQRQRLAITRALIRKPSLLILDEATNSLDTSSEAKFQSAIEAIASEYTLIVVAHRLSTIRKADKIYVFDSGRILESGSYENLIDNKGLFYDLVNNQSSKNFEKDS